MGLIVKTKLEQTSFQEVTALILLCPFGGLQHVISLNRSIIEWVHTSEVSRLKFWQELKYTCEHERMKPQHKTD